ncbi:MAG: peptidylprolyl isomerase [Burkholderiales bacterium]|jgi:peptidyl-prolyl cis-trans isomerase SurA|nr:peptidylprolyl isomerase [Burkholderiales bacterium]MBK6570318.1 peptidylprolyl isomerase [Burkholderiales bacterium]MBK7279321.1 peptidylprolyl isomerase [Burkholderiales bacterium]MBK7312984.1 peptidylprolyl isomerase [Burkholderiales bacterium]MBL0243794.1 peptidylprolyl isomerase [Rhodoferax sp.]
MTMNFRILAPAIGLLCSLFVPCLHAQSAQPADYIVAVVNSEPITNGELRVAQQRLTRELTQQRVALPPEAELRRQVLERLINERAQLQEASEKGIRVEESAVEQAEQAIARQNQIDVQELHRRIVRDGVDLKQYRSQLRDQITLQRLHEREVEGKLRVTDADIDRFIAEQQGSDADAMAQEINLANLLVAVPEKATTEQVAALQQKAQTALTRARAGEDFAALVQELSSADHSNGGQMGLRRADRYPPSFVNATQKLAVGEVSDLVRSGAGFHILKVIERRAPSAPTRTVVQTHARHILLRLGPQLTQAAAMARLTDFKKRIESGSTTFQALARENSQDGSATQGGDLGWASPGTFVPEFEEPMNRLADGQISAPVVSRFGVHLIQALERRRTELSPREVRESIRAQLRASRYEAAFTAWAQEIRNNAFVEFREPPQ